MNETLSEEILKHFPPVEFAFAYGSGAIQQSGYNKLSLSKSGELPMLDLVFAVNDSEEWHKENLLLNPHHYTPIIPMTASMLAAVQDNYGAKMWYNAMVSLQLSDSSSPRLIKYGIITVTHLIEDLRHWNSLYVAGRLHKPVYLLKTRSDVQLALEVNRSQALRTALLLLPESFNEYQLYMTVAGLSYIGDPRIFIGENPKKISNLVTPVLPLYRELYHTALQEVLSRSVSSPSPSSSSSSSSSSSPATYSGSSEVHRKDMSPILWGINKDYITKSHYNYNSNNKGNNNMSVTRTPTEMRSSPSSSSSPVIMAEEQEPTITIYQQNCAPEARMQLCQTLPSTLSKLLRIRGRNRMRGSWSALAPTKPAIRAALSTIVARAAGPQTVKGLISIGFLKGAIYFMNKVKKRFKGSFRFNSFQSVF